jgi:hypothetical protein
MFKYHLNNIYSFIKRFFYNYIIRYANRYAKRYIIVGLLNTSFAYSSSVTAFILLNNFIPDYIIFTIAGILGISFSYMTMSFLVFGKDRNTITSQNYFKFLSSSFSNTLLTVIISTTLVRLDVNIFLTQAISASIGISFQLFLNFFFLLKKK